MTPPQPALLQIAPRFCAHPTAGAEFRNLCLGARLARYMDVTHVGFLTADASDPGSLPPENHQPNHRFVAVPRGGSYRITDLLRGAVGHVPFSALNYTRAGMRDTLTRLLQETHFDIAVIEGVHLGEYVPLLRSAATPPAVVCEWHNIESEILLRYSRGAAGWMHRRYADHAAKRLARYERWLVNKLDMHVVVSERDRATLIEYGVRVPVVVIENGVPFDRFSGLEHLSGASRFRVIFTGAMDYHANVEAVTTFAEDVWPSIHAAAPQLVFTIVGRNPSAAVRALAGEAAIEVTGQVPDVRPYYGEAVAAVMPLRVGGGTRIKILEAMAAKVPVISTAIGAEGLAATPGTHYVLADSSRQMLEALQNVLQDPAKTARMTEAARDFVRQHHDWAMLGDRLAQHLLALHQARTLGAR